MADIENIVNSAYSHTSADGDVWGYARVVSDVMRELLSKCSVTDGADPSNYTRVLVFNYVVFAGNSRGIPGGSLGDYCAEAALKSVSDVTLRVEDMTVCQELASAIRAGALSPDRELSSLANAGVPGF